MSGIRGVKCRHKTQVQIMCYVKYQKTHQTVKTRTIDMKWGYETRDIQTISVNEPHLTQKRQLPNGKTLKK